MTTKGIESPPDKLLVAQLVEEQLEKSPVADTVEGGTAKLNQTQVCVPPSPLCQTLQGWMMQH